MADSITPEKFRALAKHFAAQYVYSWIYGESWYGYPDPDNGEQVAAEIARDAEEGGIGHSHALQVLDVLGLTVREEEERG